MDKELEKYKDKFPQIGDTIWVVPVGTTENINGLLLYKPLGIYKLQISSDCSNIYKVGSEIYAVYDIDSNKIKHLLLNCSKWDIIETGLPNGKLIEDYCDNIFLEDDGFLRVDFVYDIYTKKVSNRDKWCFMSEKKAQKYYDKLLKKYNENLPKYIKQVNLELKGYQGEIDDIMKNMKVLRRKLNIYTENYDNR